MTGTPPDSGDGDAAEALSIVKELRKLILEILERLTDAVKYGRRTRGIAWGLVVSVTLDVGLSVLAGFLLVAIHGAQVRACEVGNESRAAQVRLWDHVLAVSAAPAHETPAQRRKRLATLTAFRVYVHREFRPVDCARLYRR